MHRHLVLLLLAACTDTLDADVEAIETPLTIGPNVRVSDDATMAAQDQPTAATVRTRPGHLLIAAHSYPPEVKHPVNGVAAFWRSLDGGRTFPVRGVVPGLVRDHGGEFQGASDLSLGCNDAGDCYLATFVYDLAIARTAIAVSRSRDAGRTWLPPVLVIDETDQALINQRCSIAVAGDSVYVSWIRVESGETGVAVPVYFAASHDRGASFSTPRVISDPVENLLTNKPATVVDRWGRVFVVYENYLLDDPERDRHLVQVSSDGGATFTAARPVTFVYDTFEPLPPASFRVYCFPQVAIDPIGDGLLVAWTDTRHGGPDVLVTRSTDAGLTWSAARRVTDTPAGAQIQHALPALACGPLACAVSFYSSRNDPGGLLLDTYIAPIVAGHPGPNVRVSSVPMNPDTQFGGGFIGDYTALVLAGNAAHPVWTDTRVAQPDPQQDIFTARITVP
jgi:hypothetical protein